MGFKYGKSNWKRLRDAVLARDGYQCQICKRYGRVKEAHIVHHIKEADEYPELAYDPDNLIAVCYKCHNEIHDKHGKRGGYKVRWDGWEGER